MGEDQSGRAGYFLCRERIFFLEFRSLLVPLAMACGLCYFHVIIPHVSSMLLDKRVFSLAHPLLNAHFSDNFNYLSSNTS